ncbi:MAG: 3-dehydroquinate dehydratase [Candidatus Competibacteraceae bacterium]|nr:3-dehydroquinate dehydratase [Candidatus Competibacteraceae bacterium]
MQICILNGPNLNLLGQREPDVYGNTSFDTYLHTLRTQFPHAQIDYFQSNIEGEIIDAIHRFAPTHSFVINGGGYSHTSVAIADALRGTQARFVEVHISNIYARESFRHQLLFAPYAIGVITGFGLHSYRLAISYLLNYADQATN